MLFRSLTFDDRPAEAPDMEDVRVQKVPRRALEVAAAGGHNLLYLSTIKPNLFTP